MSIEKLELVRITGPLEQLNNAITACLESHVFHIENASKILAGSDDGGAALSETNPYAEPLKKLLSLNLREIDLQTEADTLPAEYTPEAAEAEIDRIANAISAKQTSLTESKNLLAEYESAMVHLSHLQNSEHDLGDLLHCKHIVCRFGRMPVENQQKLDFYSNQSFVFTTYDTAHSYAWGFYFTTPEQIKSVDNIMHGLLFEEFRIPDFVHGTPAQAMDDLKKAVEDKKAEITAQEKELAEIFAGESKGISKMYRFLKYQSEVYKLRRLCTVLRGKFFCIMGYVPVADQSHFQACIEKVPNLSVNCEEPFSDSQIQPPVKLKNGWFSKPFAMFTEMYGLPNYSGFNPTTFMAITYTIVFGIMFGDLGQGLLLFLIGLFLDKKKGIPLGGIMARIGLSSAVFGTLYGSVFGFEDLLDPVYKSMGISFLPLHAMDNTNFFIYGAIAIGAVIILISMIINVIVRLKQRNFAEAVFGNNGIMGIIFFAALLGIIIGVLTGKSIVSAPYVIFLVVLPLILMFFREPLGALMAHERFEFTGIGDFIASNFFECFEFLLGYATNTLSFIRVGGFVFSHAGLMSVVMMLAESASKAASPVVIIFGNLFVMCLEGLIVGIQVLRLEFYEIFSRCYDGDGKPFEPITVTFDDYSDNISEQTV